MKKEVTVDEIVKAVEAEIVHNGNKNYVKWVVSSALMSDVLTTDKEEILLLSNLTTAQVVRTADMVGANAILFACNKTLSSDTLNLIKELNITTLKTKYDVFEASYKIGKIFFEG